MWTTKKRKMIPREFVEEEVRKKVEKVRVVARVPTILMPETFPIANLNRYTPNFSGVPQKLT